MTASYFIPYYKNVEGNYEIMFRIRVANFDFDQGSGTIERKIICKI